MCVEFNHDKYHTDIKTRKNECIFKVTCTNPPPFTILTKDCSPSLSFHFTHDWLSIWPIASSTKDESLPTFDEAKKKVRKEMPSVDIKNIRRAWEANALADNVPWLRLPCFLYFTISILYFIIIWMFYFEFRKKIHTNFI